MTDTRNPRTVQARRMLTLGTVAVSLAGTGVAAAPAEALVTAPPAAQSQPADTLIRLASGTEAEGEGSAKRIIAEGEGDETEAEGEGSEAEAEGEGSEAEAEGGEIEAEAEGEGGEVEVEAEGEGAEAEAEGEGAEAEAGGEGGEGGEGTSIAVSTAEGESEGGDSGLSDQLRFQRDLGFVAGHLRTGLALLEAGDREAARTHMGHPIEEKFDALAAPLDRIGMGALRTEVAALAQAVEDGAAAADVARLVADLEERTLAAREASGASERDRLLALAELTRIAAEEYAAALEDGRIVRLDEYQDSWGFLRAVETEARRIAQGTGPGADAARRILDLTGELDAAYGGLQAEGEMELDPSLLFGAAARMELAALGVE